MNRRTFLVSIGLVVSVFIGAGIWRSLDRLKPRKLPLWSELPGNIRALYRQDFVKAFPDLSMDDLIVELHTRGVYAQTEFHISRIRENAGSDPLIEFDGFVYTKSELLLYAMVARLHAKQSVWEKITARLQ